MQNIMHCLFSIVLLQDYEDKDLLIKLLRLVYAKRDQVENYMKYKESILFNRRLIMVIKALKID